MFAPPVVKAQTKAAAKLTGKPAPDQLKSFARPMRQGSIDRASKVPIFMQRKLAIGRVDDPLEHEADRVADQVTQMSAAEPGTGRGAVVQRACAACEASQAADEDAQREANSADLVEPFAAPILLQRLARTAGETAVQRDIGENEIQEELIASFLRSQNTLQRQVAGPEKDGDTAEGERSLIQAELSGSASAQVGGDLEAAVGSLEGRGDPLPAGVSEDMGGRFGHDFSPVRVHTDASAAALAAQVNARAFTVGRNIAFASGEYAPRGTGESRRLLAHELAHVVQQGHARPQLQRKISIKGTAYTPDPFYFWMTYGPAMGEFVDKMHNGGKPPDYSFDSEAQLTDEIKIRANAIKGMEEVHKGCCGYYSKEYPPNLDSTYWDHVGSGVDFTMKAGKKPSDAIAAIFASGARTRLECWSMTVAIEYYSMLKGLGAEKFDAQFAGGIRIWLNPDKEALITGPGKKYDVIAVASKTQILPGDWVYFKNFRDYLTRVPGGYWQGENAIYMDGGMYRGFGFVVAAKSENDLNQELVNQYNTGAKPRLSKTVADLVADGGGLLLSPVIRPIIAKISP